MRTLQWHIQLHSHALAASALHTPLNCHPTPTPVSLSARLSSTALALPATCSTAEDDESCLAVSPCQPLLLAPLLLATRGLGNPATLITRRTTQPRAPLQRLSTAVSST
ncbi:hypothetical protein CC77DRAFT_724869 [Alternaria alternata]|uniref:Uncharacterized protein n=1 Tax=Alternaria alternata TaxID=5599 RepID=A0A177D1T9_ALTAL|nr:hypothetical protein CC77DRAFT_724869 [Alternaria alternata]OAG13217.1 hypothetical protein CC77DRAFT_724869 [Alternaria alternata]